MHSYESPILLCSSFEIGLQAPMVQIFIHCVDELTTTISEMGWSSFHYAWLDLVSNVIDVNVYTLSLQLHDSYEVLKNNINIKWCFFILLILL